ncbi:prolyl oligopeptidase family serine peptidase [Polaribacter sp. Asnod1-A03]|uniref:prolyl oligopeptidase family serine peptidase n=1 Tax=Polaribacter sp. Asnod1-A03 TaxID=3160581 RepID=UPI003865E080
MNKFPKAFLTLFVFLTCSIQSQLKYPITDKIPVIDTYHDIEITDNYQWLENLRDVKVKDWVENQNKVSLKYLNKLSNTNGARKQMKAYDWYEMDFDKNSSSERNDKIYYRLMYPGKNSQPNIYYKKGNKSTYQKLIGPNSISKTDRISFTSLRPSFDDRFLAYQYNRNGSDWEEIKIVGIKNRVFFKETLTEVLSPQINWYGQGFFYVKHHYNAEKVRRTFPEVMYHTLSTPQSEDKKVFSVDTKDETLSLYGTENQSLYLIKKSNRLTKNYSYLYIRPKSNTKKFTPLFTDINYDMSILRFKSDTIIANTQIKKNRFLISFPVNEPKKWSLISPSYEGAVFTDYEFVEDKIVTSFQTEKSSFLVVSDTKGKVLGEVVTPDGMSVSNLYYNKTKKEFTFKLSSYTIPPVTCKLNLKDYTFKYLGKAEVNFDAKKYHFMRKKFVSHDGTEVPMFIVYKDSIAKDGNTPFLLKTYGGYGTIAKPNFDAGVIYFIENGGAFAYVNIRGGGELGYDWWQEGRNLKKKNGILDFSSAAEYLVNEGYTKPKKIGIIGTSHGGLITAGAMIEKPELFGAAVINVGALDMLRMEQTETGASIVNKSEFGTVKKKDEFMNLLSYSPFYNIKENVNYPSTLLITGTNDTRVPPYQSYKFAGKLQNGINQKNPVLLWTQEKEGHFGASQYNSYFEEKTFIYSFLINELTKE